MQRPCRQVVIDALDDLGERDRLSYTERTSWEEPYPPSFVEERLETLRRDLRWTRRLIVGLFIFVGIASWVGMEFGWGTLWLKYGIPGLLIPQLPTVYMLIRNGKAEALYALLREFDGQSGEPVEPSLAEVA